MVVVVGNDVGSDITVVVIAVALLTLADRSTELIESFY